MPEAELWQRLRDQLGDGYAATWADTTTLNALGSRTVQEALRDSVPCKLIWRAVWEHLELPDTLR